MATKVIANRITETSAVPRMPASTAVNAQPLHRQQRADWLQPVVASKMARYTTATPSATQRNAGVTVITAVMRKKAAITPRIALAMTAKPVQLVLLSQQKMAIIFHLLTPILWKTSRKVSSGIKLSQLGRVAFSFSWLAPLLLIWYNLPKAVVVWKKYCQL